ncbi:MAG: SBBP repeat-containing protein, partial [Saprospiraceae bacterium]
MFRKLKILLPAFLLQALLPTVFQAQSACGFIENKGQILDQSGRLAKDVAFLLPLGNGLNVQLRHAGFSYDTYAPTDKGGKEFQFHRIDIEWLGGNPNPDISTGAPAPDLLHFFGARQAAEVRHFQKITYHDIYPGIDIEFLAKPGSEKPVEYNFVLKPGASVEQIQLRYTGALACFLDGGNVWLRLASGALRENIPASWTAQSRQPVNVRYKLVETSDAGVVFGFEADGALPDEGLVVDPQPTLVWGTYLGGGDSDSGRAMELDAAANSLVVGTTRSMNAIATAGAHQIVLAGAEDVLVAKFSADGVRIWSSYLGGTGSDFGQGVALDAQGNVYVTGYTHSPTGIATAGAHQPIYGGGIDAFIAKFNPNGLLIWSTYFGGGEEDRNNHIAVRNDRLCVVGWTRSQTGIATAGAFQTMWAGNFDATLALFDLDGQRIWSTYLGSDGWDVGLSIALTPNDEMVFCGWTSSVNNIASAGGHQTAYGGGSADAFLAKFDLNGNRLWATYYGGSNDDYGDIVGVNPAGDIFFGGPCSSPDNMSTPGAFQPTIGGGFDAFLAKFTPNGTRVWGTYYGGGGNDNGYGLAFRGADIYFSGFTSSANNIATPDAHQSVLGGGIDAYLVKFDQSGLRQWATYYGGSADDYGYQIGVDAQQNVYMVGAAHSNNGISTPGAHQANFGGGGGDLFLAKFSSCDSLSVNIPNGGWLCRSDISNFVLQFDFSEPGNYTIYWDADGVAQSPIMANANPYYWFYSGNWQDSVRITAVEINGCPATLSGLPFVRVVPETEALDTSITCLPDLNYIFSAVLAGGAFGNYIPIPINSGFVNGNVFTSMPIPSGQPFLIGFTSGLNCDTIWFSGSQTCECVSSAISAGAPQSVCQGDSVVLSATGGVSYIWDNGVTNGVPFTPSASGVYTVVGTDANGCTGTASVSVTVNPLPALSVTSSAASVCAGESVTLTASGASSYVWDNGVTNGAPFTPSASGVYTVVGTGANGCTGTASVSVAVNPIPTAQINGDLSVCAGNSLSLSASGGGSYVWSTGQTTATIVVTPSMGTTYSVTVSDAGCSSQSSISVNVIP